VYRHANAITTKGLDLLWQSNHTRGGETRTVVNAIAEPFGKNLRGNADHSTILQARWIMERRQKRNVHTVYRQAKAIKKDFLDFCDTPITNAVAKQSTALNARTEPLRSDEG